jgi:hypothetical protein
MSYELSAKIASLEMRHRQHDEELRLQRQELIGAANAFAALSEDHQNLVQEFQESRDKVSAILAEHREELKDLAVLVGNSASMLFPKMEEAFQEIDKALGLDDKSKS